MRGEGPRPVPFTLVEIKGVKTLLGGSRQITPHQLCPPFSRPRKKKRKRKKKGDELYGSRRREKGKKEKEEREEKEEEEEEREEESLNILKVHHQQRVRLHGQLHACVLLRPWKFCLFSLFARVSLLI